MKVYVGAPAGARHYLEADRGRADDYYLAEGAGVARRFTAQAGRLSERDPLAGYRYETWVAGRDPDTGQPWGRLRTDDRAVRFVEVVVNGPKSWSLAAALHPEIAAAYEAAQDRAAAQIIGWLAEHATTRVGPRGGQVQVPVEVLEAVTVRHYTSRAGDPHRHLHLQLLARVFAAGKWRGLHTVAIRDFLAAINGIGHSAVATDPQFRAELAAHGYTLNDVLEIEQLAAYVGPFSARAQQIAANVNRYEREWMAAHPGEQPGPSLRRAWDARAWAEGRPDKAKPRPGGTVTARWLAELTELGFRPPRRPVDLTPIPVGSMDRDATVGRVLSTLAAGRSAWNAADIRGEVEKLIASAGVVVEAAVRIELAEDLTARALERCLPLLPGQSVPEHVRAWTSRPVLEVEADLTARLTARAPHPDAPPPPTVAPRAVGRLDAGQVAAVAALVGDRPLVVVEGAAGAGKTSTLVATADLLAVRGCRLVVATPTLKAAQVAAAEVGAAAGSAAWLAFQHGWRWKDRTWRRLQLGQVDPGTGRTYRGPEDGAQLRAGDLLVVDEAGMLDQDTARALLTLADECQARVALLGDRHQLAAVGRGGVLDLAARAAGPAGCLTLDAVHRFTRTDGTGRTVRDSEYADLTLAMREGTDPGAVFDALTARRQIRLHPDAATLTAALAETAADHHRQGERVALIVDTGEQAHELNAAVRQDLVAAARVDDTTTVTTRAGQRIGAGDRIATRRNDRDLAVANRDVWTVAAVSSDGQLTVVSAESGIAAGRGAPAGARQLPAEYVAEHVQLAYATTAHGAQGDTVPTAHLVIGEHTGAATAYVGMTRGRTANTAHLVADSLIDARDQWIAVCGRDRADLGPGHAAVLAAAEAAHYAPVHPALQALEDLQAAFAAEQRCRNRLHQAEARRDLLHGIGATLAQREADHTHRLAKLTAACQQTAANAENAARRIDASATVVSAETDRLTGALATAWRDQRDTAYRAAELVLDGPGRLRLRRGAVTRAAEELTAWADTWRPCLPSMPTDPRQIATLAVAVAVAVAVAADDPTRLQAAFDRHARRLAEQDHPEHAQLAATADATRAAHDRARRDLTDARRQHEIWIDGLGEAAQPLAAAAELAATDDAITAIRAELAAASSRIEQLRAESALLSLPGDRLARERDQWRARGDLERKASWRASPPPARSHYEDRSATARAMDDVSRRAAPSLGISR